MLFTLLKRLHIPKSLLALLFFFSIQCGTFLYVTFRPVWLAPKDHSYLLTSKSYFFPIFFYPNEIHQAKNGAWGIKDIYTTQPAKRAYAVWFFVLAGKIASILHIDPMAMFILLQISGGMAVFVAAYLLIRYALPAKFHIPALYFALIFEISPILKTFLSNPTLTSLTATLPGASPLFRNFGLPHHAWGEAFGLLSIIFLLISYRTQSIKGLLGLFITSALSIICLPPVIATLGLSVYPILIIWAFCTKTIKKLIPALGVALITVALIGIQTKLAFDAAGFPWNAWTQIEKTWWISSEAIKLYIQSFELYLPFFTLLLGVCIFRWKAWSESFRLIVLMLSSWIVTQVFYMGISDMSFFPFANMRLIHGDLYIAAGILASIGFVEFVSLFKNYSIRNGLSATIMGITAGISLLLTISYTTAFLKTQENPYDTSTYPLTTTLEGILFLRTIPIQSGVMTTDASGSIIPGFADVRVYVGDTHGFVDWMQRKQDADAFFSGTLSPEKALDFLTSNDCQYVFFGPNERAVGNVEALYSEALDPVFKNSSVTIYSIAKQSTL